MRPEMPEVLVGKLNIMDFIPKRQYWPILKKESILSLYFC